MSFYESPLFVEILIISIYVLLTATLLLAVWSMLRSLRLRDRQPKTMGIPEGKIAWGVFALMTGLLVGTYLLADTSYIYTNGKAFTDPLWLRISDMLINTSIVLISIAVICVIAGAMSLGRKLKV
jgi:hypothetical protein